VCNYLDFGVVPGVKFQGASGSDRGASGLGVDFIARQNRLEQGEI
jgi:hypothetical protein